MRRNLVFSLSLVGLLSGCTLAPKYERPAAPVSSCRPTAMRQPLVRQALRRDPALRKFLRWSILPLAEVERSRCSIKVSIGDARYQDSRSRSRLSRETVVPTGARGC